MTRAYYPAHHDKCRDWNSGHCRTHPERLKERHQHRLAWRREYYRTHHEKCLDQTRAYRKTHADQLKEYDRRRRLEQRVRNAGLVVRTPNAPYVTESESGILQATETPGIIATSVATWSPIPFSSPTRIPSSKPTGMSTASSEQPTPTFTPPPDTPIVKSLPSTAPRLLSPTAGSTVIAGTRVELNWESAGELGLDEWYDVQIWKDDETPHGIAWSKENQWIMPADFPTGKYQWRIVVIQGKDGKWIANLSAASETGSLNRQ